MLTIILLLSISIVLLFVACKTEAGYGAAWVISFLSGTVTSIALAVAIIIAILTNINAPAIRVKQLERYNSLTYQYEHMEELYGDSKSMDRKTLMDDICEWNEDVVGGRIKHKNVWTNWFEPIDWNEFKVIELK